MILLFDTILVVVVRLIEDTILEQLTDSCVTLALEPHLAFLKRNIGHSALGVGRWVNVSCRTIVACQ